MVQNDIDTKHKLFVEKVAASKLVWGLKDKNGFANTHSAESEDEDVIPFWSDKVLAKACARDDWKGYLPVMIPLPEFLEQWCVGMAETGALAGIEWNASMLGIEAEALAVALDLLEQLNTIGSDIKFLNYDSIDTFIAEIKTSAE